MTDRATTTLEADCVSFAFEGRRDFLTDVSFVARAGECWGIVGPNGAGKSTLLRLLAGLRSPSRGVVRINGRPLSAMSARERARQIAYQPQQTPTGHGLSAGQVVLLGRHPHKGLGVFESAADIAIARDAMVRTETVQFIDRPLDTLSGGEAQRVHLAAALAQEPGALLLDEPTTALDWRHQLSIFEVLRSMVDDQRVAVVIVTHDMNLAGRYCDGIVLMQAGRVVRQGATAEVLTADLLASVFDVGVRAVSVAGRAIDLLIPGELAKGAQE